MHKRSYYLIAIAILCSFAAPNAFGTSVLFPCSPSLTLTSDSDYFTACPSATVPPAAVTAVRLYLIADFQNSTPATGGDITIPVFFLPQTINTWSGLMGTSCLLTNGGSGTVAVTDTCGFYSRNLNAPGTRFLLADDNLANLAATGFEVESFRLYINGSANMVFAQNIVEYVYTPEPPVSFLFGASLILLGWLVRRNSKAVPRHSRKHRT